MDELAVITNISDLESLATGIHDEFQHYPWWRGHSDKDWTLQPAIWRNDYLKNGKTEFAYMNHFQGRALNQQESRRMPQDDVEWLFLAQHYRLPTRLLDWTESPLVALYFAVNPDDSDTKSVNKDACLWVLSPSGLNRDLSNPCEPSKSLDGMIQVKEQVVKDIVSAAFGVKRSEEEKVCWPKVLALQPWESNERIVAQSGRFTIHSSQDAIESLAFGKQYLKKIIIPRDVKEILKERLKVLGFRQWSIFPDLENLARGLRNSGFSD